MAKSQEYFCRLGSFQDNVDEERVNSHCSNGPCNQDDNVSAWGMDDVEQVNENEGSTEGEIDKDVAFGDEWGSNNKDAAEINSSKEHDKRQESSCSKEDTVFEVEGCVKDFHEEIEIQEPDADSYIWCSGCDRLEYQGCEVHTTLFGDNKMFELVVSKSGVRTRNAGIGVCNKGNTVIPEGTLFGPYSGMIIPLSLYKEIEKLGKKSGNGWEVKDKEGMKFVGYVDTGLHPYPEVHWMSKINCAMDVKDRNLVGFQFAGQIYYRAMKDIPTERELLVYYGESYATGLGINVRKYDLYRGKEAQTKEVIVCKYCSLGIGSEERGEKHSCKEKRDALMVRKGETGERSFVCMECGKGFLTRQSLSQHSSVHTKIKEYICLEAGCGKRYSRQSDLVKHRRVVHEGFFVECDECGRRFGQKGQMERHFKTVHLQQKDYKCPTCGISFGLKYYLKLHIKTVHKQIKAFECQHCGKRFGQACNRKKHIEAIHLGIRYPCTWEGCNQMFTRKFQVKIHVRQVHTKEWSWECQLCEDQKGNRWGCMKPGEMDRHKAKNHPVEWEQEQENYRRKHPHLQQQEIS